MEHYGFINNTMCKKIQVKVSGTATRWYISDEYKSDDVCKRRSGFTISKSLPRLDSGSTLRRTIQHGFTCREDVI